MAEAIAKILPPTRAGRRLLDVGCGPGTLSLRLAGVFTHSVGLDPDPDMVAEARERASQAGLTTAEFIQARAEDLPLNLGMFDVVAFGQSFHWMDRDRVAATVRDMLPSGGLFLQIADLRDAPPRDRSGMTDPSPPYDEISALVRKYLGPVRRAGRGILPDGTPGDEVAVLARNGFGHPTRITVPAGEVLRRSQEDVVAWVYSRSDSAPALLGADLAAFDAELRTLLADAAAPHGRFAEHVPDTEVVVWHRS